MLPPLVGAALVWGVSGGAAVRIVDLSILYGGALLCFLAGVRRGLSFRQPDGPTAGQIGTMLTLFFLGGAALGLVIVPARVPALALLVLGCASLAVLDPLAARNDEVPTFFARLRPLQMPIAVASYIALLAYSL